MAKYKIKWFMEGYHDMDGEWTPCYGRYSAEHYKQPYSYWLDIVPNDNGYYLFIYLCLRFSNSKDIRLLKCWNKTIKQCKEVAEEFIYSRNDFTSQIEQYKKQGDAMFDDKLEYVGVSYVPPHYYETKEKYNKYTFWDVEIYPFKQYSTIYIVKKHSCDSKPYLYKNRYYCGGHSGECIHDPKLIQTLLSKLDKKKFAKYFD